MANGAEILCLTNIDRGDEGIKIALGMADRVVQVWVYLDRRLQMVFSRQIDSVATVPCSIYMADNPDNDVYLVGMHDGKR